MDEKEVVVGIDLGTTNSCIAIWDKYKVEVIPNDYGERTTPSIVHFFSQDSYSVGLDAKIFLNLEPKSTIYSTKRVIGLNFNSKEVEKFKKDWPFKIINKEKDNIEIEIEKNNSTFTVSPEIVSCYVLKKLKSDAENFLKGKKIKKAVVAVPHYFNNSQKEATITAANMAGFEDVILINEPTAASMAFSFDKILETDEKKLIIFDLGGGTFDVSLLTIEEGIIDVICVNGDTKLGGDDIDVKLCDYVEKKIREMENFKNIVNLNEIIEQQKGKIKSKCEFVKKNLTSQKKSIFHLPRFYNDQGVTLEITREELESLCKDFLEKIGKILDNLFIDAKKKKKSNSYDKSQIDYIILIGGATKMPAIINFTEKYFGKKPITSFNPDETVAIGAALRGETLFNNSPYLDSLQLIDVIPLNIGIMVGEDKIFSVILKKNTYIPCRNKKNYIPLHDYQSAVEINIYEGNNKYAEDNNLLGKFLLEITPKKVSETTIEVSFNVDEHLILNVSAEQISEGKSKQVSIKKKNQLLTNEELELEKKKIEKSKIINMNEGEKIKYCKILEKQKGFFSGNKSEKEVDEFINLVENYISEFKIKENNIHFMIILFRLYNLIILKKKIKFDTLEEKINKYLFQISDIDVFYVLNFISKKFDLDKTFQENLTILISSFFSAKGMLYLSENFKEKKNISFELFQLSIKLIDDLFVLNNELKNNQQILDLINDNEQYLKCIKINDISLKIKDIYDKNSNDEKYLNQIIELYQNIVNLIKSKEEIEYINDFDTLYKLGDNNNYLLNILDIMNSLNAFIIYIDAGNDIDKMRKNKEFTRKLNELNKFYKESQNINQEYFKYDYSDYNFNKIQEELTKKYNDDKKNHNLTNFAHYILENHPPMTLSKSIDEFKKNPNIKILVASYSKSITKKYKNLKNKEKLREKINLFVSEMFSNNVELKSIDDNGEDTDNEDNNDKGSLMTDYTNKK